MKNALYQMTKITSESWDVINIYRSRGANTLTFSDDLQKLIDTKCHTIVIEDFNICYRKNPNHEIFKMLKGLGFHQLVLQPNIDGGIVDL